MAAVELKGGQNVKVRQLVEQLQGGLDLLEHLTTGQTITDVIPILLYSGNREIESALAKHRVAFRGNKRRIVLGPCGSTLVGLLSDARRTNARRRRVSHRLRG